MSPEAQRIAIAEHLGWTGCGCVEGCQPHGYPPNARKPTIDELIDGTGPSPWDLPRYLTDLNAMHEAEKVLTDEGFQWDQYIENLIWLVGPITRYCHATATQRAEAFLRTIGKWEGGQP